MSDTGETEPRAVESVSIVALCNFLPALEQSADALRDAGADLSRLASKARTRSEKSTPETPAS
jgi:hypothetical protein